MANEYTHHTYNIPIAADVRKKKKNNKPRAASDGGRENDTGGRGHASQLQLQSPAANSSPGNGFAVSVTDEQKRYPGILSLSKCPW